jgi:hypothetical protein
MCPNCGHEADAVVDLAIEVYDAGRYHRETHYGRGSHMPMAWISNSYADKVAPWGFRLFDYLLIHLQTGRPIEFDRYLKGLKFPDGLEGDYYRALMQSFHDIFLLFETKLT